MLYYLSSIPLIRTHQLSLFASQVAEADSRRVLVWPALLLSEGPEVVFTCSSWLFSASEQRTCNYFARFRMKLTKGCLFHEIHNSTINLR
jgi:hypothetical protein